MKKITLDKTLLTDIRTEETLIPDIRLLQIDNELEQNRLEFEAKKEEIYRNNLQEKDKELERYKNIIEIMEKYFELINDLAFDYDGCETTGDLMNLIDELKKYASLGRVANTTEVIYVSGNNKKYNILHEELKGIDN